MRAVLRVALAATVAVVVATPASAQVTISLSTAGCFYTTTQCTLAQATATSPGGGLTFTGNSLSFVANPGNQYQLEGSALPNLGLFKLARNANESFADPLRFRLFVSFTAPSSATPNPYTTFADFDGAAVVDDDNDDLIVDFGDNGFQPAENPFVIIDYDGAATTSRFGFRLLDVTSNLQRDITQGRGLFGRISCQQADIGAPGGCSPQVLAPVTTPEPSTYALMAAGLAGIGVALRRRRNA